MSQHFSRRSLLKNMAGGAAALGAAMALPNGVQAAITDYDQLKEELQNHKLKGRIKHSVCKWCYDKIPLDDFCRAVKEIGLSSVELVGPSEWPTLKKYDLYCAMPWGAHKSLDRGFNDPAYHDELVRLYEPVIPQVAAAGFDKLICFSGNRRGMSDEQGLENCVKGLQRLLPLAEKHKVTLTMELLNSKVNHKDYQCDHSAWGVELVKRLGSDRFRLLYDIYHMQIMEGDVIRTIRENHQYFNHYHTGGVPGRNEINDTQELYYPAIMNAIVATGYKGYVAQEFIPKNAEPLVSLRDSIRICDV